MDDVCLGKLVLYPHCISIVASPQTEGRIRDCPAKRYAARVGDAVSATRGGGRGEKSIRQNARFHTAAQRIIIDPRLTKTLGIRRMQACLRDTLIIYAERIVSFVLFKMARGFAENVCEIIWSYFGLGK